MKQVVAGHGAALPPEVPRSAIVRLVQWARRQDLWFWVLATLAISYAFICGLRPIHGDDLFFMLNTARWVVEQREIPWTDVFSYTAYGNVWIYPIGGSLLFYAVGAIGGYALLSALGAIGCAGTTALLLRRNSLVSVMLAVLAVPLIATRCQVRADLFTTVLSAAFLALLWRHHETGRGRLWLLPILMVVWVNAHLGFILGLLMIAGYAAVELLEMPWPERRRAALRRLRRAWPWLLLCFPATLLNPYSLWIYEGVLRQVAAPQLELIGEWAPVSLNWRAVTNAVLHPAVHPHGPVYIVMAVGIALAILGVYRRQFGAAVVLLAGVTFAAQTSRMGALLGIVTVIVGTSVVGELPTVLGTRYRVSTRLPAIGAVVLALAMGATRLAAYAEQGEPLFAVGLSPAFPQGAAAFILRERFPGEVMGSGTYMGAYLTWTTGRRSYFDARLIPFGPDGFNRMQYFSSAPPGAALDQEAARYGINAVVAALDEDSMFKLREFCNSDSWPAVYLDDHTALFVRRAPETKEIIARRRISCDTVVLPQGKAGALIYEKLKRYPDALAAIRRELEQAPRSASAHLIAGELLESTGAVDEAEKEYRTAASILPDAGNEMALAGIARRKGRIAEEIDALRYAVDLNGRFPLPQLQMLTDAEMRAGHPSEALAAIERAISLCPGDPAPEVMTRTRDAILHAIARIARSNPPPLPGGYGTGLRR